MSHYTIGVIIPPEHLADVRGYLESQLEPFDENIKVAPYVSYDLARAEQDLNRQIGDMERILATGDDQQYNLERCQEVLDECRLMTPEQKYREYCQFHDRFDRQGRPLSTYNPDSKWDWYQIGGRWGGWLYDREDRGDSLPANLATVEHLLAREKFPFALVTPDGCWHERGQMGWWGIVMGDQGNDAWRVEARRLLEEHRDHSVVLVDAHI